MPSGKIRVVRSEKHSELEEDQKKAAMNANGEENQWIRRLAVTLAGIGGVSGIGVMVGIISRATGDSATVTTGSALFGTGAGSILGALIGAAVGGIPGGMVGATMGGGLGIAASVATAMRTTLTASEVIPAGNGTAMASVIVNMVAFICVLIAIMASYFTYIRHTSTHEP